MLASGLWWLLARVAGFGGGQIRIQIRDCYQKNKNRQD